MTYRCGTQQEVLPGSARRIVEQTSHNLGLASGFINALETRKIGTSETSCESCKLTGKCKVFRRPLRNRHSLNGRKADSWN